MLAPVAALGGDPGDAGSGLRCQYVRPLSAQQQYLREMAAARKLWGLPHSRALIRRLERDPRAQRRRDVIGIDFALRAVEARYFRQRFRVQRQAGLVARRAEREEDLSGGVSIEDDFPRGAYVLLRVTRELSSAERAEFGRDISRLKLVRVARSERMLEEQQERIDWEALERDGIDVQSTSTSVSRNAVIVEFSSDRADAEAVLQERYGPGLIVKRIAPYTEECTSPDSYRVTNRGRTLVLRYITSGSAGAARVQLLESRNYVSVAVIEQLPPIRTSDAVARRVRVKLTRPLGSRHVVSTITRRTLHQRGE